MMKISSLILALGVCAIIPSGAAAAVYVTGEVRIQQSGAPMSGAVLVVHKAGEPDSDPLRIIQSLPNGSYVLKLPAAGSYQVTIDSPQLKPFFREITVPAAGLLGLDLVVEPVPSLLGWLHDPGPRARQFRSRLSTAATELAAAQKTADPRLSPTNLEQFQAPLPPPEQNAALEYVQLAALLKQKPLGPASSQLVNGLFQHETITPAQMKAVRQLLADRQDVMGLIHRAADKEKCVFQRDWRLGAGLPLPEYAYMRQAERLLSAEEALYLEDGKPLEAVVDAARSYRIAAHAASDPILIAYLVGRACEGIATRDLAEILRKAGSQKEVALAVQDAILHSRPHLDVKRTIPFELSTVLTIVHSLRQIRAGDWDSTLAELAPRELVLEPPGHPITEFTPEEKKLMQGVVDALEAKWLQQAHILKDSALPYTKPSATLAKRSPAATGDEDPLDTLSRSLFSLIPTFNNADKEEVSQARADCLLAATFVLLYRADHAAFPASLEEAMPHPPQDPFTGVPLHYRLEPPGFVIYSAGPTHNFTGGQSGVKPGPEDALFRYP